MGSHALYVNRGECHAVQSGYLSVHEFKKHGSTCDICSGPGDCVRI